MSRVLVYWLKSHNMFGWCMHIGLWKYIWLYDKIFLALAYPLLVWLLCMLFFYLCDDHQFIDGSICERYSWSTEERWLCCIVYLGWSSFIWAFLLGPRPMFCFSFWYIINYCCFTFIPVWHRGVPFMFELPWIIVRNRV